MLIEHMVCKSCRTDQKKSLSPCSLNIERLADLRAAHGMLFHISSKHIRERGCTYLVRPEKFLCSPIRNQSFTVAAISTVSSRSPSSFTHITSKDNSQLILPRWSCSGFCLPAYLPTHQTSIPDAHLSELDSPRSKTRKEKSRERENYLQDN